MSVIRWKNELIGDFGAAGGWPGGTGLSAVADALSFNVGGGFGNVASAADAAPAGRPKLTTLVGFTGPHGQFPRGLIADAAGDLFGVSEAGGAEGAGTVYEIAMTRHGYASAPTTLVSFTGAEGVTPTGSLFADAAGDLFGATVQGGADSDGTVFEIAKTKKGYAGAPTTLVSFTGAADGAYPDGGLIADAAGDLFGTTTEGGADDDGTVFEIARTKTGYAGAPTTLVSFTGADGDTPNGGLIADAAGDLFGTTPFGGANGDGTVFEIIKTRHGYAGAPTTLFSFGGAYGASPDSLIADAEGDLFGTTSVGGTYNDGTVFEIARTKSGYASKPTTLASFTGVDGADPSGLIVDAVGDLFGTTDDGGADGDGTVFEIVKTKGGYAGAPTTLVSFTAADGAIPTGLIADAAGDLFGPTLTGGPDGDGTVYEITHSGFMAPAAPDITRSSPLSAAFVQAMAGHGTDRFGSGSPRILASRNETLTLLFLPHVLA